MKVGDKVKILSVDSTDKEWGFNKGRIGEVVFVKKYPTGELIHVGFGLTKSTRWFKSEQLEVIQEES